MNHLILCTPSPETERAVRRAVGHTPGLPPSLEVCQSIEELGRRLQDSPSTVVLVDVDPDPMSALALLAPVIRRNSGGRFIVLCDEFQSEVVLEAMQVGARHCLVKDSVERDLVGVIDRLLKDVQPEDAEGGRVVTVLTSRGGCGGTTIAINLADELRESTGEGVLIVDLDEHYGAVASYLGLSAQYGVADVLAQEGAIDAQLVTSTAAVHSDGLHALVSPASVDFSHRSPVRWENLPALLSACRAAYQTTVIDASRVPLDIAAALAERSAMTLVVFELAVIDLRNARSLIEAVCERGVEKNMLRPVANRWRKRNPMVGLDEAREALGMPVEAVANDYVSAAKSINYGQTLATVAPRSPLRRDLQQLAGSLARKES